MGDGEGAARTPSSSASLTFAGDTTRVLGVVVCEGYACAVGRAADALVRDRYLLRADADRMVAEAAAAHILPAAAQSGEQQRR